MYQSEVYVAKYKYGDEENYVVYMWVVSMRELFEYYRNIIKARISRVDCLRQFV